MKNTKQTTKSRRTLAFFICLALLITLLPQSAVPAKAASTWTIQRTTLSGGGSKFTVKRSESGYSQTVQYRTVSISALAGKHFTEKVGSLTFGPNDTEKSVTVSETSLGDVPLRYRYYSAEKIYYRFEVTDPAGALLAENTREYYIGTTNAAYHLGGSDWVNRTVKDLAYFNNKQLTSTPSNKYLDAGFTPTEGVEASGTYQGYVLIDDSYDYTKYPATLSPDSLFVANRAGGSGEYYKLIGDKLFASVIFTEKEKDDGYAYVQILTGDANTPYDEGYDPNGAVNDPVKSIYKACFELQKGSGVYSGSGQWIFPHYTDQTDNGGTVNDFYLPSGIGSPYSYLWQQKYRSEDLRGLCTVPDPEDNNTTISYPNNAFLLDPDVGPLTVRFDCGGNNDDTYGYKDVKVRWALWDNTAPTVMTNDIAVSPGIHAKGNRVTISIPFSEPVLTPDTVYKTYYLYTSWGKLALDLSCEGTNVLSYTGEITADPGTVLKITGFYESTIITDLVGIEFDPVLTKTFSNYTVDETYTINYGSYGGVNPTKYTAKSDAITLVNPTRNFYTFAGWTGTGLTEPTMTVTIPTGSTGNRKYTATWTPDPVPLWGSENGADGSAEHPYIITSPEGLVLLSTRSNVHKEGFGGVHFKLGCDIDMAGVANFTPIGQGQTFFGSFDGDGHAIRNLTSTVDGRRAGLFAYVNGTAGSNNSITNIILDNATFTDITTYQYAYSTMAGISAITYIPLTNCFVLDCTISGKIDGNSEFAPIATESLTYVSNCYWHNCVINGESNSNVFTVTVGDGTTAAGTPTVSYKGVDYYSQGAAITVTLPEAESEYADYLTGITSGETAVPCTQTGDTTYTFNMPAGDVTVSVVREYRLPVGVDGSGLDIAPLTATKLVRNVPAGLTVAGMKALLQNDPASLTFKQYDETAQEWTTLDDADAVGTGTVVDLDSLYGAGFLSEYTLVVTGDVSGDGLVNTADYNEMKTLILENDVCGLNSKSAAAAYEYGVDFNGDEILDVLDLREMKRLLEKQQKAQKNTTSNALSSDRAFFLCLFVYDNGKVTRKSVPISGVLSQAMAPFMASVICLAMARPSPCPPV